MSEEIITRPGKFEGEPRWVEYFYDLAQNGEQDEEIVSKDGTYYNVFKHLTDEYDSFPELKGLYCVAIYQREDGFACHHIFTSARDYIAWVKELVPDADLYETTVEHYLRFTVERIESAGGFPFGINIYVGQAQDIDELMNKTQPITSQWYDDVRKRDTVYHLLRACENEITPILRVLESLRPSKQTLAEKITDEMCNTILYKYSDLCTDQARKVIAETIEGQL